MRRGSSPPSTRATRCSAGRRSTPAAAVAPNALAWDGPVTPSEERRRTISVEGLARVEGEGSLRVELRDGRVEDVELQIFEPPRFFEAFLRGRRATEAPDLTARICGICPVAYQMSACAAVEDALGIDVGRPDRGAAPPALLRRMDAEPFACTSTCCMRPTSSDARTRWSWRSATGRHSSGAWR